MRHIRKKFLNEFPIEEKTLHALSNKSNKLGAYSLDKSDLKNNKILKENHVILFTDNNTGITTFQYNNNGTILLIPEADPVLIYFHSAQSVLKDIESLKNELLKALSSEEQLSHNVVNRFYDFFGTFSNFIIMLYTSMEAFVNRQIPHDFKHENENRDKTEVYTAEQFIRKFSLDYKIKYGLNKVTGKDFAYKYALKANYLNDLKELRDNIVHTKVKQDGFSKYDYLFKKALVYNYMQKINSVRDFINFYQPGLIEDCPCGQDF